MDLAEKRGAIRMDVELSGRCRTRGGLHSFVAIVDLTAEGCCIMTGQTVLEPGQSVTLQPETLSGLRAEVRWVRGDLAGLRFEAPLYGPVCEHLVRSFGRTREGGYEGATLPPALRMKLLDRIRRAEAASMAVGDQRMTPYRSPLGTAARPAIVSPGSAPRG